MAMYAFALNEGFEGAVPFLERFSSEKGPRFYNWMDFIIVTFSGSVIGTICFWPQDLWSSLPEGFGG